MTFPKWFFLTPQQEVFYKVPDKSQPLSLSLMFKYLHSPLLWFWILVCQRWHTHTQVTIPLLQPSLLTWNSIAHFTLKESLGTLPTQQKFQQFFTKSSPGLFLNIAIVCSPRSAPWNLNCYSVGDLNSGVQSFPVIGRPHFCKVAVKPTFFFHVLYSFWRFQSVGFSWGLGRFSSHISKS